MTLSFTQEADFRKEREFGQKISATFEFIQAHWRPLGRVLLYTVLPAALLHGLLNSTLQIMVWGRMLAPRAAGAAGARAQLTGMGQLIGSPLYWLNALLSIAFVALVVLSIYGYLLLCLRREPAAATADITAADVWAVVRREFLGTYLSIFGVYFLVLVGMFLFVLPGIYLSVMLSLFFIVRLVEGTGFRATVSRCRYLIQGKWWSTFGLIFVMSLLLYALLVIPSLVAGALGGLTALARGSLFESPVVAVIFNTVGALLTLLFYLPLLLVLAFQYFNLVERREGTGLRGLVSQLGQAAPTARNASLRADEEGEY